MKKFLRVVFAMLLLGGSLVLIFGCKALGDTSETTDVSTQTPHESEVTPNESTSGDQTDVPISGDTTAPQEDEALVYTAVTGEIFTILSNQTSVEIEVVDGGVAIKSVKNLDTGYNWTANETVMKIPDMTKYKKNTGEATFDWQFKGAYENTSERYGYSLKLVFENAEPAFTVESIWNICGENSPVQHTMYVINNSQEKYTIYSQQSMELSIKDEYALKAWRFHKESFQADSVGTYCNVLSEQTVSAYTTMVVDTSNSSGFFPIMYFDADGAQGLYLGWEWCHGRVTASPDENGTAVIKAGFNDDFMTVIAPGTKFLVPTAYIGTYTGDLDDGTNEFNHWFYWNKTEDAVHETENEPLTQLGYVDYDYEEMGIESVQWDYGWWGDDFGEGVWELHHPGYIDLVRSVGATNLKGFATTMQQRGVNFTLYILLHDSVNAKTGLVNEGELMLNSKRNLDWFSSRYASKNASADLGNEDCVAYIKEKLYNFMSKNNIKTWRVDMEAVPWDSEWDNRHVYGLLDTTYWNAVGYYEIVDYLFDNLDGFRNEVCGSGGAYKDYATLTRTTVMQTEDRATYNSVRQIFYTTSYGMPSSMILNVVNFDSFTKGTTLYEGPADVEYGIRSVIMACPMMDGSKYNWKLAPKIEEAVKKYYNIYNDYIANFQKYGNLYRILPRPDFENWDGVQYYWDDSTLDQNGVVFLFKPTNKEGSEKTIVFKGLDASATYTLTFEDRTEQNCEMTGADLMSSGLTVTIEGDFGSEMIWIRKN